MCSASKKRFPRVCVWSAVCARVFRPLAAWRHARHLSREVEIGLPQGVNHCIHAASVDSSHFHSLSLLPHHALTAMPTILSGKAHVNSFKRIQRINFVSKEVDVVLYDHTSRAPAPLCTSELVLGSCTAPCTPSSKLLQQQTWTLCQMKN